MEKLIQSYVLERFFISTGYYKCSSVLEPLWYYETRVFVWDKETKKLRDMIEYINSGKDQKGALISHNNACLKYFMKYTLNKEN